MKKHILFLSTAIFIFFCTYALAEKIATRFEFPVGKFNVPPTEGSLKPNGFKITQNFNTSSNYEGGGAKGAWCGEDLKQITSITDKLSCEALSLRRWMFGHTGVDLSDGTEKGFVRAIANGIVEYSGSYERYGNLTKIKHTLPNGKIIHSLYGHQKIIFVSKGDNVVTGQLIGIVGKTGAGSVKHLHLAIYADEMEIDPKLIAPVGYIYNDEENTTPKGSFIYSNTMRDFYDPLLFIEDRSKPKTLQLTCCDQYSSFTISIIDKAVTKTAFIEDSTGEILSLQHAVDAGWIEGRLYNYHTDIANFGSWWYYTSKTIEEHVLVPGITYAFKALKQGLKLTYFRSGYTYPDARVRQDMYTYTAGNSSFSGANTETFTTDRLWCTVNVISKMDFDYWDGTKWTTAVVEHIAEKDNPLKRRVTYIDPVTGHFQQTIQVY